MSQLILVMKCRFVSYAFLLLIISAGCSLNTDDYNIKRVTATTDITVPVAYGALRIDTILQKTNSDYTLVYTGNLTNLGYTDSIEFETRLSVDSLKDFKDSEVLLLELKSVITNELPLDTYLTMTLEDVNQNPVVELIPSNQTRLVTAATVDANGNLLTAGTSNETIQVDATKINKIFISKYLTIRGVLKTSGTGLVTLKFNSSLRLNVNFGLRAQLKVTGNS